MASNPLSDLFASIYGAKAYRAQATSARAQAAGRANSMRSQANANRRQARDVANVAGRNMMAARVNQTRALSEVRAAQGRSGVLQTAGTGSHAENALRQATDREIDNLARQTSAQMSGLYAQAFTLDNQASTEEFMGEAQARYYNNMAKASRSSAWIQGMGMALNAGVGFFGGMDRAEAYNEDLLKNNPKASEKDLLNPYKAALFGGSFGLMNPTDMYGSMLQRYLTATPKRPNGFNIYGSALTR